MRAFLSMVSALADPTRLRLLMSLQGRELCVCNLVDFIGLADSTVSKHMSILKQAGLVDSTKKGRWVYYRLAEEEASPLVRQILALAREHLREDHTIMNDNLRMADVIRQDGGRKCQQSGIASESDAVAEKLIRA